jgi:hypothetical protein
MPATTTCHFALRGVLGVLSLLAGIGLALTFQEGSEWAPNVKTIMVAFAYCAAIGGVALFSSYYQQATFKQLKSSLLPMAVLLATLLLFQLVKLK